MSGHHISRRTLLRSGTAGGAVLMTGGWSRPTPGPATDIRVSSDGFATHAEPWVAVNPRDPENLIGACMVGDTAEPDLVAAYASFDGGRTWTGRGALPLPAGTVSADDVTVAFTPDGHGFVAAMATGGRSRTDRGIYFWRTEDGGRTFQPPRSAVSGVFVDHPTFTAQPCRDQDGADRRPARLSATWVADDHQALGFTRSLDGGTTFEPPRAIQGAQDSDISIPRSAEGPNGLICAVYAANPDPATPTGQGFLVQAVTSTDGGAGFGAPAVLGTTDPAIALPGDVFAVSGPAVAADPRSGLLSVAFTTYQQGTGSSKIMVCASVDGGATWTAPTAATPAGQALYFQPQLAVDHRGRIRLSAFALVAGRVGVVLCTSEPGHPAFGPPVAVTPAPFDPTAAYDGNPKHGAWWIGDYQGLATSPRGVHPFWNDTRTGRLELYTALVR